MTGPQYNVRELIDNIKRRCVVPTSQLTYGDDDFTTLANDEMRDIVVPLIMSTREEYFVDHIDATLDSTGVVVFPAEAVGAKLRSVCIVQQASPLLLFNLPRLDLDVVAGITSGQGKTGFFIEGNNIHIYPEAASNSGTTLRIYYYKRALVLAEPLAYAVVTAINTLTLTLSRVPSGWTTNTVINTVSSYPSFNVTNSSTTISGIAGVDVTVSSVTGIVVGDYVSEYGYSAVPQIPVEAHGYLAQLTAAKVLEGLGDSAGMKMAMDKAQMIKVGLLMVVSQRVDGSTKKVVNPSGGLRNTGRRWI